MLRARLTLLAAAGVALLALRAVVSAPTDFDPIRDLQTEAIRHGHADWGYWGPWPSKYTGWSNHSNRLIPVYTFGIDLNSVRGKNSPYRSPQRLEQLYGYLPTETLNPQAEYFDETDIYRVQQAAVAQGKKRIILFIFDGMDWQTTQAAAIYRSAAVTYNQGRGSGLHLQDYRGVLTDFGYFVTSPRNTGTEVDVDSQTIINSGGTLHGGYSWRRGGDTPWAAEADPQYLISKSKDCPHAFTDSSSAGTSLCTGVKTYDDSINVDFEGKQIDTIALQLQRKGFAVGAVTSVPISHATPASAYAQNVHRDDYQDIARDLLGLRSVSHRDQPLPGLDVLIGTGWHEYDSSGGKQGANFIPGFRYFTTDDLNQVDVRNGGRYQIVERTAGIDGKQSLAVAATTAAANKSRLLGIFGTAGKNSHLPFRTADNHYNPAIGNRNIAERYSAADLLENPTLAGIATAALTVLSQNPKGFWLMIEAGDVDWGNHDNNIDDSIGAVLSGDDAVKAVTDWVEAHGGWSDTALIITADHGHYLHIAKPEVIAAAAKETANRQLKQAPSNAK